MREHVFQADEDGIDLLGREAVEVAHLPSNVAAEGVERAVVLGAELVGTTAQREDSSSGSGREGGGGAGGDEQWPDEGGARRHCDVRASSARLLLTCIVNQLISARFTVTVVSTHMSTCFRLFAAGSGRHPESSSASGRATNLGPGSRAEARAGTGAVGLASPGLHSTRSCPCHCAFSTR